MSFLGPEGTYAQEACEHFFGAGGELIAAETVADAVDLLVDGQSDFCVIPQENTIGGPVVDYLDVLLAAEGCSIVGEVELPISQNLLVLPETVLQDIKTVYSHKQGIAQGREWLAKNLPDAEAIEVSSTAEGARLVAENARGSEADICSAGCAEVYGLEILATDIQQNDLNKTRFYVLSQGEASTSDADRMVFVASDAARDLPALLQSIAERGVEVIAVHDRPEKTELGRYRYLIECADASYEDYEAISASEEFSFRYLGSFVVR